MTTLAQLPWWVLILYFAALVECAFVTFYGALFWARYRKVDWHSTPEGEHIMRFTQVVTLTFGFTLVGQLAGMLGVLNYPIIGLVASNILFPWAAWELRHRNILFSKAQAPFKVPKEVGQ